MSEYAESYEPANGNDFVSDSTDLLGVLEERIERLIERHRDARKTIEDLQSQLSERDQRVAVAQGRADQLDAVRAKVAERVEALIERVALLEQGTDVGERATAAVSS